MTEEEKRILGEKGEIETMSFLKNFGITTQRADLIGCPFRQGIYGVINVCGESVRIDEAIRIEVKTRTRLWDPPPRWAVGLEDKALRKYEKLYEMTKIRTLIVVPVLADEKNPKSIIGGYFVQWLHKLMETPKEKYFYVEGNTGDKMKNICISEFEAHYVDDELKIKINSK